MKLQIGKEPPHTEDMIPVVDAETGGRNFYEEVQNLERAKHLIVCWNCHEDLLEACKKGLELSRMLNHPYELEIEAAIEKAEKGE